MIDLSFVNSQLLADCSFNNTPVHCKVKRAPLVITLKPNGEQLLAAVLWTRTKQCDLQEVHAF